MEVEGKRWREGGGGRQGYGWGRDGVGMEEGLGRDGGGIG